MRYAEAQLPCTSLLVAGELWPGCPDKVFHKARSGNSGKNSYCSRFSIVPRYRPSGKCGTGVHTENGISPFPRHETWSRESFSMQRKQQLKGVVHETLSFHMETAQATWCKTPITIASNDERTSVNFTEQGFSPCDSVTLSVGNIHQGSSDSLELTKASITSGELL